MYFNLFTCLAELFIFKSWLEDVQRCALDQIEFCCNLSLWIKNEYFDIHVMVIIHPDLECNEHFNWLFLVEFPQCGQKFSIRDAFNGTSLLIWKPLYHDSRTDNLKLTLRSCLLKYGLSQKRFFKLIYKNWEIRSRRISHFTDLKKKNFFKYFNYCRYFKYFKCFETLNNFENSTCKKLWKIRSLCTG